MKPICLSLWICRSAETFSCQSKPVICNSGAYAIYCSSVMMSHALGCQPLHIKACALLDVKSSWFLQLQAYIMSSMFAFSRVITQNAMQDHACGMTVITLENHTDSMISRAWFNLKTQNPVEFLNHQTKYWKRLTQSAVQRRARLWPVFCTISASCCFVLALCFAQVAWCEPLQVVALETKVYWLYSLCQRRGCPGLCCFLCNAFCLQLAA